MNFYIKLKAKNQIQSKLPTVKVMTKNNSDFDTIRYATFWRSLFR